MDSNDIKAKNLVFDKYIVVTNGNFSLNKVFKLLIDNKTITIEDALNIIFELMYGVINYNYDENDVDEEFKRLAHKVIDYNRGMQASIKNAVLFFNDYSYVRNLFVRFSSNLKFDDEYKNEIESFIDTIESSEDTFYPEERDVNPITYSDNSSNNKENNSVSLEIRERMELDKEIRRLSKELRKQNPYNWREILKNTEVYKKRHGLEMEPVDKSNIVKKSTFDSESKKSVKKADFHTHFSEKEIRKLKIRSNYLSNKIKYTIKDYSEFIGEIESELSRFQDYDNAVIQRMMEPLNSTHDDLKYYKEHCDDFELLDEISRKINAADDNLKIIKNNIGRKLSEIIRFENERLDNKFDEYHRLIEKVKPVLDSKLLILSELSSQVNNLINEVNGISSFIDKKELMDNLENIQDEINKKYDHLNVIKNRLNNDDLKYFVGIQQANNKINGLNRIIDELNQISREYFEEKIIEQEKLYQNLLSINEKIVSENIDKLLEDFDSCLNRSSISRQFKNFQKDEENIIINGIRKDIINQKITGNVNFRKIIKSRCTEFKNNNSEHGENEIEDILNNVSFIEVDDDIFDECKDKVKKEYLEGNITINQVELKFKNNINKKITELDQLKELDMIKNNHSVPSIQIHLTQEEKNEIYTITKMEILSEHGIDNVENRFNYWANKKIRENQSEARGRFDIIIRDLSNLTRLNDKQQGDFINLVEFCIYENQINYYDITEENIIKFSEDFISYGEIKLR